MYCSQSGHLSSQCPILERNVAAQRNVESGWTQDMTYGAALTERLAELQRAFSQGLISERAFKKMKKRLLRSYAAQPARPVVDEDAQDTMRCLKCKIILVDLILGLCISMALLLAVMSLLAPSVNVEVHSCEMSQPVEIIIVSYDEIRWRLGDLGNPFWGRVIPWSVLGDDSSVFTNGSHALTISPSSTIIQDSQQAVLVQHVCYCITTGLAVIMVVNRLCCAPCCAACLVCPWMGDQSCTKPRMTSLNHLVGSCLCLLMVVSSVIGAVVLWGSPLGSLAAWHDSYTDGCVIIIDQEKGLSIQQWCFTLAAATLLMVRSCCLLDVSVADPHETWRTRAVSVAMAPVQGIVLQQGADPVEGQPSLPNNAVFARTPTTTNQN